MNASFSRTYQLLHQLVSHKLPAKVVLGLVIAGLFVAGAGKAIGQTEADSVARPVNPIFQGNTMLQEYIDLVQDRNFESARMQWSPYAHSRSVRLGIQYEGISIKADLNSPLVKLARFHPVITPRAASLLDSAYLNFQIQARQGVDVSTYQYYGVRIDGYTWLTFPQDYIAKDWITKETRFFRFHISPTRDAYVNEIAIKSLDNFVDSLAVILDVSPERMKTLASEKIDYYFCADEQEVERITGVAVRGLYDLAADALVTSALPHYHEVAHLMVNFRLQSMPLTTIPLFREGIATYLGGRSTSSPSALLDMAAYLYRLDVVFVDSLLELMAFHEDMDASISYSAAGLFIKSLVDSFGMNAVLDIYRELSGNLDQTKEMSLVDIRESMENRFSSKWEEISENFKEKYVSGEFHNHGADVYLRPGLSGLATGDSTKLSQIGLASDPLEENVETSRFKTIRNVTLIEAARRVYVRALPDRAGELNTTIFFGKLTPEDLPASELFEEQFKGATEFKNYRFSLRFDGHEAGIYDYATSTLIAKYLTSFTPEAPYFDATDSTVSFSFPLSLVKDVSPLNDPVILSQ